ncbi:MAG: hypothetical protein ACLR2O_12510 [Coprococcus sp.]
MIIGPGTSLWQIEKQLHDGSKGNTDGLTTTSNMAKSSIQLDQRKVQTVSRQQMRMRQAGDAVIQYETTQCLQAKVAYSTDTPDTSGRTYTNAMHHLT